MYKEATKCFDGNEQIAAVLPLNERNYPSFLRRPPRHSCEGRNLDLQMMHEKIIREIVTKGSTGCIINTNNSYTVSRFLPAQAGT